MRLKLGSLSHFANQIVGSLCCREMLTGKNKLIIQIRKNVADVLGLLVLF